MTLFWKNKLRFLHANARIISLQNSRTENKLNKGNEQITEQDDDVNK